MKKINISHVNNMHNQWLRILNFYKTEIQILRGILTEIAGKNTGADMLKEVEHYENQFRVQTNNIDTIVRGIHVNVDAIAKEAAGSSAGYIDAQLLTAHSQLGDETAELEKLMVTLMQEFRKFAATWM